MVQKHFRKRREIPIRIVLLPGIVVVKDSEADSVEHASIPSIQRLFKELSHVCL